MKVTCSYIAMCVKLRTECCCKSTIKRLMTSHDNSALLSCDVAKHKSDRARCRIDNSQNIYVTSSPMTRKFKEGRPQPRQQQNWVDRREVPYGFLVYHQFEYAGRRRFSQLPTPARSRDQSVRSPRSHRTRRTTRQ